MASQHDVQTDLHARDFLARWDLVTAYDALFADSPGWLDELARSFAQFEESGNTLKQQNQRIQTRSQMLTERLLPIFQDQNLIPFLIRLRMTMYSDSNNLLADATASMDITSDEAEALHTSYRLLLGEFQTAFSRELSRFQFKRAKIETEHTEDQYQARTLELIEAVIQFPYWESWAINPKLTVNRLIPYIVTALPGYRKGTDAYSVGTQVGNNASGDEISFDIFRGAGDDPAEIVASNDGYLSLQELAAKEAARLGQPATAEMLLMLAEGGTYAQIATDFNLSVEEVRYQVLKLRKALRKQLDAEHSPRSARLVRQYSTLWHELSDLSSIQRLRQESDRWPAGPFRALALKLALDKAEDLLTTQEEPLSIPETRDEIIRHVASVLQQRYPGVSRIASTAQSTARRAISHAWQLLRGWDSEKTTYADRSRADSTTRKLEGDEWRSFATNNPGWLASLSEKHQDILRLYYLSSQQTPEGEKLYTQGEVAELVGLDASRVSRILDQLNQERIRQSRSHRGLKQVV